MKRVAPGQLSFAAAPKGGRRQVELASLKLSGAFPARALVDDEGAFPQLDHGEQVIVKVVELGSGELIAEAVGDVKVGFDDTKSDGLTCTTRVQTIKMGCEEIPPRLRGAVQALVDHLDENDTTATLSAGGKSVTVGGKRAAKS